MKSFDKGWERHNAYPPLHHILKYTACLLQQAKANYQYINSQMCIFSFMLQFLKSLRHPCILKYLNVTEVSNELYLVIERSSPLPAVLDSLDPIEITTGIYSVMEALTFLHEQVRFYS